ncbi:hypothetical protein AB0M95_16965 [Sphaerisporangium sp. NPDC051017]|uniref:WXG100-like domain-containing protein n=1 Tax=Sphaerisporangium sp. NPDC051017 TaxID=3154636 RepID=UPI0034292782
MASGTNVDPTVNVNPNTPPGQSGIVGGGTSTSDVTPAWGESLPGWVDLLISLIVSGQSWPEASETLLWELAKEHQALGAGLYGASEPGVNAARTVLAGWDVPATPLYLDQAARLFTHDTGVPGLGIKNLTKAMQADNFARETQYSKISINVAFWVAVTAAFIALVSAFFTAGATTSAVGPIAASARAAIARILQRLAAVAGRDFGTAVTTRLASATAARAGLARTVLASHLGRELIEEIGEEVFIDAYTQKEQMDRGSRTSWDWSKTSASAVGAGGGAIIGTKIAGPLNRYSDRIPLLRTLNAAGGDAPGVAAAFARFPGRAVQTGLNNMAASPGGSILANGLVYGQFSLPDGESLLGAAMGGAGRTNTISPFNPSVPAAVLNPGAALHDATTASALTDLSRLANTTTTPPGTHTASTPPGTDPGEAPGPRNPAGLGVSPPAPPTATTPPHAFTPQTGVPQATAGTVPQHGTNPQTGAPQGAASPTTQHATNTQTGMPHGTAGTVPQHGTSTQTGAPQGAAGSTTGTDAHTTQPAPHSTSQAAPPSAPLATASPNGTPQAVPPGTSQPTAPPPHGPSHHSAAPPTPPSTNAVPYQGTPQATADPGLPAGTSPSHLPIAPQAPNTSQPPTTSQSPAPATSQAPSLFTAPVGSQAPQSVQAPGPVPQQTTAHQTTHQNGHAQAVPPSPGPVPGSIVAALNGDPAPDAATRSPDGAPPAPTSHANGSPHPGPVANAASRSGHRGAGSSGRRPNVGRRHARAGTVTAEELADSDFRPDARPAGMPKLDVREVPAAIADLRPGDFAHGTAVRRLGALPDGSRYWVETTSRRVYHFSVEVGRVPRPLGALSGPRRVARTKVRSGDADDPMKVRIAPGVHPDQLARVLLHETSDALRRRAAIDAGSAQGIIRGHLPGAGGHVPSTDGHAAGTGGHVPSTGGQQPTPGGPVPTAGAQQPVPGGRRAEGRDECVTSRRNEIAHLVRKWNAARTPEGRRYYRREAEATARDIERRGHMPPSLPWPAAAPASSELARARELTRTMADAADALTVRSAAKLEAAIKAADAADKANKAAEKAQKAKDLSAPERLRRALADADVAADDESRNLRVAEAYQNAAEAARQARLAYEDVALALEAMEAARDPREIARLRQEAEPYTDLATTARTAYDAALEAALPSVTAPAAGHPFGTLPHVAALARTLNDMMRRAGVDHEFTASALESRLFAEFAQVASADGHTLRVGRDRLGEVRVKLHLSELLEILDLGARPSEFIRGWLPQGGASFAHRAGHRLGQTYEPNYMRLIKMAVAMLPDTAAGTAIKVAAAHAVAGVGHRFGREESTSASSYQRALGGGVDDNRGESPVFEAAVEWEAEVRTAKGTRAERVTGAADDPARLRLALSHSYAVPGPEDVVRLPPSVAPRPGLPRHVVLTMDGVNDLVERTADALGGRAPVGSVARDEIRQILTQVFPARLGEATALGGLPWRVVTDGTKPVAEVQVVARLKARPGANGTPEPAVTPFGVASGTHFQELLRIESNGVSVTQASGRSHGTTATVGAKALPTEDLPVLDDELTPKITHSYGRSRSHSETSSATTATYNVSVQRAKYGEPYAAEFEVEVRVRPVTLGRAGAPAVVPGEVTALLRTPVWHAYRSGWPVDARAVVHGPSGAPELNDDGSHVLRDQVVPGPPPGRLPRPPVWAGEGPGRLRGAGPALVQDMRGVPELKRALEKRLREMEDDHLPPLNAAGDPVWSLDPVKHAAQELNKRIIDEQLTAERLESGYNTAVQNGVVLPLVHAGLNRSVEYLTLLVQLDQRLDRMDFSGVAPMDAVVNLQIGSDTAGTTSGETASRARDVVRVSVDADVHGQGEMVTGGGAGVNTGRDAAATGKAGNTTNNVKLGEGANAPAAEDVPHTAQVFVIHPDGRLDPFVEDVQVWARLGWPVDLLPPADPALGMAYDPAAAHPTSLEEVRRGGLLHLDTGPMLRAVLPRLPYSMRPGTDAFLHVAALLSTENLLAHSELLFSEYGVQLPVHPQGQGALHSPVTIRAVVGPSTLVGRAELVTGDILFGMGSYGTATGATRGFGAGASAGAGTHQASAPKASVTPGVAGSRSVNRSNTKMSIWGVETLAIDLGIDLAHAAPVRFEINFQEAGEPIRVEVDGAILYRQAERRALKLYADGARPLPLTAVADAVERFLGGDLTLDRRTAIPLVRRYLADLHQAQRSGGVPELSKDHTRRRLLHALGPLLGDPAVAANTGSGSRHRLAKALSGARSLANLEPEVSLPDHYLRGQGQTAFEHVALTMNGERVELLDEMLRSAEERTPGIMSRDPVLRSSLSAIFGLDRWLANAPNLYGPQGLVLSFPVRVGPELTQRLTVRMRWDFTGPPRWAGHTPYKDVITQIYDYEQEEWSASPSGTGAVSLGGEATGGPDLGALNGGIGTDRAQEHGVSASDQRTDLSRMATFSGGHTVRMPFRLTVDMEWSDAFDSVAEKAVNHLPGLVPAGRAPTLVFEGEAERLVSTGMVGPAGMAPATLTVPDPGALTLPADYVVEVLDTGDLLDRVRTALAGDGLLGENGMRARDVALEQQFAPMSLMSKFKRLATATGDEAARLTVPGHPGREVRVRLRARPTQATVIVSGREGVEFGVAKRHQDMRSRSNGVGRPLPVGWDVGPDVNAAGDGAVGTDYAYGVQAADTMSTSDGVRMEETRMFVGDGATVTTRVNWDAVIELVTHDAGGGERVGKVVTITQAAVGTADLSMPQRDISAMLATTPDAAGTPGTSGTQGGTPGTTGTPGAPWPTTHDVGRHTPMPGPGVTYQSGAGGP